MQYDVTVFQDKLNSQPHIFYFEMTFFPRKIEHFVAR